ncbi:MAG: hypothetical protein WDA71_10900 [Actinomycetota bacterium]
MGRSFRAWILGALALSLALSACGTQRMGHNAGAQTDGSSQATQETQGTGADLAATPTGSETPGPASASGGRTTAKGSLTPSANATGSQAARTASDRGVTKGEIVLAILASNESSFESVGIKYEGRRHEEVMKPFVDDINSHGGINGRKLVVKLHRYNPLSQDERSAACVKAAEDFKAFAVLAPIGFWGDPEVCLATKETPLITGNNSSADTNVRREKGWVHQTMMNKDRLLKNWVDWAISSGLATSKTRNGIVYTEVPEDRQVVNDVLIPYMKQRKLQVTEVAALSYSGSPNPDAAQVEGQASTLKFKASGVDLVWPVTNFLQMLIWAQQADAAAYKPRYTVSDFGLMATSESTASFPASQWEGTRGITSAWSTEVTPGQLPKNQAFRDCEAVYKAHGLSIGPDPNDASRRDSIEIANMTYYCEHLALFAEVARRAGVNPTRRSLLAAFDGLGTWSHRVAVTERLSYARGKLDGADYFAVVKWKSGCTSSGGCYLHTEGFRKGTW